MPDLIQMLFEDLGNVESLATYSIGNLMTATRAIGDHPGIGVLANSG